MKTKGELISISAASRLLGTDRATLMKAAVGLTAHPGLKNSKLYDARALMMSYFCGNERARLWEGDWQFRNGEWEENGD